MAFALLITLLAKWIMLAVAVISPFTMYATIFLQSGEVLKLHYLEETVNKDQGSRFLMELVSNSLVTAPSRSCTFGNKVIVCTKRQLKEGTA